MKHMEYLKKQGLGIKNWLSLVLSHWFVRGMITTTLSVFLAFTVDRVYEDSKATQQFNEALLGLHQEYQQNIAALDTAEVRGGQLRDSIYVSRRDSSVTFMALVSKPPYLATQNLQATYLAYFLENERARSDFELLSLLSEIDQLHQEVAEMKKRLINYTFSPEANDKGKAGTALKRIVMNCLGQTNGYSFVLKDRYARFEAYLRKREILKE
jgi:hypothetical protein